VYYSLHRLLFYMSNIEICIFRIHLNVPIDLYIDGTRLDKTVFKLLSMLPMLQQYYTQRYKSHSLNISPFYVCFLFIRFPLYSSSGHITGWHAFDSLGCEAAEKTCFNPPRWPFVDTVVRRIDCCEYPVYTAYPEWANCTGIPTPVPRGIFFGTRTWSAVDLRERSSLYSAESLRHLISRRNICNVMRNTTIIILLMSLSVNNITLSEIFTRRFSRLEKFHRLCHRGNFFLVNVT